MVVTAELPNDEAYRQYGHALLKPTFEEGVAGQFGAGIMTGLTGSLLTKTLIDHPGLLPKGVSTEDFINFRQQALSTFQDIAARGTPSERLLGGTESFVGDPATNVAAIATGGVLGFAEAPILSKVATNGIASLGVRTGFATAFGGLAVAPAEFSHAFVSQTTPIKDDFTYIDAVKDTFSNAMLNGMIHLGVVEPTAKVFQVVGEKLNRTDTKPLNIVTQESKKASLQQAGESLDQEKSPDLSNTLQEGYNDARLSGNDPKQEEVNADIEKLNRQLDHTNKIISEKKEQSSKLGFPEKVELPVVKPPIFDLVPLIRPEGEVLLEPEAKKLTNMNKLYHGTSNLSALEILKDGKIDPNISRLDNVGQNVISLSHNPIVANNFGALFFEMDAKEIKTFEAPKEAFVSEKGEGIIKGLEVRTKDEIPIEKIKKAVIPLGLKETLDNTNIYNRKGEKIGTLNDLTREFIKKNIKVEIWHKIPNSIKFNNELAVLDDLKNLNDHQKSLQKQLEVHNYANEVLNTPPEELNDRDIARVNDYNNSSDSDYFFEPSRQTLEDQTKEMPDNETRVLDEDSQRVQEARKNNELTPEEEKDIDEADAEVGKRNNLVKIIRSAALCIRRQI